MKRENIPLISVIVPIYNGEKYLKNCVHAIVKQTWRNYEVIMINDGSTDKTENVCLEIIQKYPEFKYYYQKNAGAGAARNKGIEISSGVFFAFVDVDDYLYPTYLEELYYLISKYNAQISCCSYVKGLSTNIDKFLNVVPEGEEKCFDQKQALISLFYRKEIMGYSAIKLIHRELIGDMRFPTDLRLGEDFLFAYAILRKTSKIIYTDKVLYFYVQSQNGLTHSLSAGDMKAVWRRMTSDILYEIENESEELKRAVVSKLFMLAYDFSVKLLNNDTEIEFRNELRSFLRENRFIIVRDSNCTKINKILGAACCINIKLAIEAGVIFVSICKKLNWSLRKAM